jgi:transposase-like protein
VEYLATIEREVINTPVGTMQSFTLSTKRRILQDQESEGLSNSEICRRHNLQLHQLQKWKAAILTARFKPKLKRKLHPGRRSLYFDHEQAIADYILEARRTRSVVNIRGVISKLHELSSLSQTASFKSKQMWAYHFIRRHGFSIRKITRQVNLSDEELSN